MLPLNASSEVTLDLVGGEIYSNANHLICFNGFLYDPASPDLTNPMNATAWSVQRSTSLSVTADTTLTFDSVEVNENNVYDEVTGQVTVTIAGYYFISINAAAAPSAPVDMHIVVNDVIAASLTRVSTVHGGVDSLGRSAILRLNEGDVIRVDISADTEVYSDSFHQTSFTGFLIVNRDAVPDPVTEAYDKPLA